MVKESFGWVGKILRVNLTDGKVWEEPTKYADDFIGGIGLCMKILWNELPIGLDPFHPDNRLIFATGPLTGTLAPTAGRVEVCTKAPGVQPSACTRSGFGGDWGPELKFAGYDDLIIQGRAEKPVYLLIHNGEVEVKDAADLWGLDTYATQKAVMAKHGREVKTVCIGPAGENLNRTSVILTGTGYAAGKTGMGAVMGSKKLKAVAVKGAGGIKIARPKEFIEVCRHVRRLIMRHTVVNWCAQGPIGEAPNFVKKYRKRLEACFGCPVACRSWIEVPGLEGGEAMCLAWYYLWLGADDKSAWEGKILADKLGLDQYQLYDVIRWMKELNDEGVVTEEGTEIPWKKLGSAEFIKVLLEKITYRKGFGDILAEGPARAAELLGGRAREVYEGYFPNWGQAEHYSVRSYPVVLMQWATDSRDPMSDAHDWTALVYWPYLYWPEGTKGKLTQEQCKAVAKEVWGSEEAAEPYTYEKKAQTAMIIQNMSRLKNSLILCDWQIFPILSSPNTSDLRGDPDAERKLFCTATGKDLDKDEWLKIGERIFNLERAILVREGRRRMHDTVLEYYFKTPETVVAAWEPLRTPPPVVERKKFEEMKNEYYTLRGWNVESGIPTQKKLKELGLSDVAEQLRNEI